jgi:hypothetical protein
MQKCVVGCHEQGALLIRPRTLSGVTLCYTSLLTEQIHRHAPHLAAKRPPRVKLAPFKQLVTKVGHLHDGSAG